MKRQLIFWLILICLTGCGFHLRGAPNFSLPLQRVYLNTSNPYGELSNDLRDYLKMSGVVVTQSATDASTVLVILSETEHQQLLSTSVTQQTRQYNLTLTVDFEITSPTGVVLVPAQQLTESRIFTAQSDQILGASNEAAALYKPMRESIVYAMMNRLSSHDITQLLTKAHS